MADCEIKRLQERLAEREHTHKFAAQEEQFRLEMKLHEERLRLQNEFGKKSATKSETEESGACFTQTAKLPKLVISKFEGSCMDWPRF
jgi:predicted phage tail protein